MLIKPKQLILLLVFTLSLPAISLAAVKTEDFVPAGAPIVLTVDLGSLLTKSNQHLLEFVEKNGGSELAPLLSTDSGLDFNTPMRIFASTLDLGIYANQFSESEESVPGTWLVLGGVAALKNPAQFKAAILKLSDQSAEFKKGRGFEYTYSDDICLAWTSDLVIFAGGPGMLEPALLKEIETILNGPRNKYNTEYKEFRDFASLSTDISFWMDTGYLKKEIAKLPTDTRATFAILESLDDSYMGIRSDFLNGALNITIEDRIYGKSTLLMDDFRNVDKKILDMIPGDGLVGLYTTGIKTQAFNRITEKNLKSISEDDLKSIKETLGLKGRGLEDLFGSFKGDFAFSLGNVNIRKASFDLFCAMTLTTPGPWTAILDRLVKDKTFVKNQKGNQSIYSVKGPVPIDFFIQGGTFFITSKASTDSILAGKKPLKGLSPSTLTDVANHDGYALFELGPVFDSLVAMNKDPSMEAMAKLLRKIEVTYDVTGPNLSKILVKVATASSENSLATLLAAIKNIQKDPPATEEPLDEMDY